MPAYSVPLGPYECSEPGCKRRAVREVRNTFNEKIRDCCAKHAHDLIKKLNAPKEK